MEGKLESYIQSLLEKRFLSHIIFWLLYLVLAILYGLGFGQPIMVTLILRGILLPFQILATYTFIYWQLPLIPKRRYVLFGFSFLLSSYIFSTLAHLQNDFGLGLYLSSWHQPHDLAHILGAQSMLLTYITDIYILVFCVTAIRLIKHHFKSRKEIQELLAEKAKSEYNYINSRLQPEFLLRTLKLIEREAEEDSDNVSRNIEDLSTILDYSLYKGLEASVPLEDELEHLEVFINTYIKGSEILDTFSLNIDETLSTERFIKPLHLIKLTTDILHDLEAAGKKHAELVLEFKNGKYSYESKY